MESMTAAGGFETVLEYLSGEIMHGHAGPGTRLPNERELAARLGTSRSAVREAIKVLNAQGVVTTQAGSTGGTRVASHPGDAIGRMLKLHVALDTISMRELTQTRMVLERAAAEVAAVRADEDGLQELDHLIALQHGWLTAQAFHELDTAFHLAVARMGDNRLVRDLTIAIREAVASHLLAAEHAAPEWERVRPRLVEEHRGIAAAIRLGDSDAAGRLAADHVRSSHEALRLLD